MTQHPTQPEGKEKCGIIPLTNVPPLLKGVHEQVAANSRKPHAD